MTREQMIDEAVRRLIDREGGVLWQTVPDVPYALELAEPFSERIRAEFRGIAQEQTA